jgi:hypothetical protein
MLKGSGGLMTIADEAGRYVVSIQVISHVKGKEFLLRVGFAQVVDNAGFHSSDFPC